MLQRLEAADLAAELAAHAEVVASLFEGGIHQPDQIGRAGQRRFVEGGGRGLDELCRRAVEAQARQVAAVLGRFLMQAEPFGVALHQSKAGVAGDQPGIGRSTERYVGNLAAQLAVAQHRQCRICFITDAGREEQPLAGQQRVTLVRRQ